MRCSGSAGSSHADREPRHLGQTVRVSVLIVDGYNVVHAWPALKRALRERGLEDARRALVQQLAEYAAQTGTSVTVVFDAHSRDRSGEAPEVVDGVTIRFGTRHASADHVIERLANEAARRGDAGDVTVATGDRLQRAMVGAMGVATISARALEEEVLRVGSHLAESTSRRRTESGASHRVEHQLDAALLQRLKAIGKEEGPAAVESSDDN
jgi:predicted RNA-binding protein with PIN domain